MAARLWVRFYNDAVEDEKASRETGRPIYQDVEMVEIRYPGDNKRVLVAPAHQRVKTREGTFSYAERFQEHYAAFKSNAKFMEKGTPLKEAPFLTEARRRELERANILTVESLAELDATALRKLGMGYVAMGEEAKRYLAVASELVDAREKEELRKEIAEMKAMMAKMTAASQASVPPPPDPLPLEALSNAELKALIKDHTGKTPKGNPSREKLLAMAAEEVAEEEAA